MVNRLVVLCLLCLCCVNPTFASSHKDGALKFEIPIEMGAAKYLEFLEYPAYLVAALENNSTRTSNMGSLALIDERTVQFKNATLHFSEKKGEVYLYKGRIEWVTPLKSLIFDIPVEIDTSSVSKGNIRVSIIFPLANFVPDALVERIKLKVQAMSALAMQRKMLNYFNDLSKNIASESNLQAMFPVIMFQAYNAPRDSSGVCPPREPGDAESLADQAYLLATLAIWLIVVPTSIAAFIYWRKRKKLN
jgi:hypothetical protein